MSIRTKSMEQVYQFYSRRLERPKKLKSCIVMEGDNTKAEPSRHLLLNSFISLPSVLQQNLLFPFCGGSQVYQTFFAARVISWLHALNADFFAKRYDALVSHWDKCLRRGDGCVEKWCACLCICLKIVHATTCIVAVGACIHFWNIPHTSLYYKTRLHLNNCFLFVDIVNYSELKLLNNWGCKPNI